MGYLVAVSLLKPPCGGFRSENVTWIQKCFFLESSIDIIVFKKAETTGVVIEICVK